MNLFITEDGAITLCRCSARAAGKITSIQLIPRTDSSVITHPHNSNTNATIYRIKRISSQTPSSYSYFSSSTLYPSFTFNLSGALFISFTIEDRHVTNSCVPPTTTRNPVLLLLWIQFSNQIKAQIPRLHCLCVGKGGIVAPSHNNKHLATFTAHSLSNIHPLLILPRIHHSSRLSCADPGLLSSLKTEPKGSQRPSMSQNRPYSARNQWAFPLYLLQGSECGKCVFLLLSQRIQCNAYMTNATHLLPGRSLYVISTSWPWSVYHV